MLCATIEEEDRRCRACHSQRLRTDWAQGDRVCTDCGIVDEHHLVDEGPEWREFNDADDLAKGRPSAARSGLVPVDETKYVGGLEPTTISKHVFGGSGTAAGGGQDMRKRLIRAHRRVEHFVGVRHRESVRAAQLSARLKRKRSSGLPEDDNTTTTADEWEEDSVAVSKPGQDLVREEEDRSNLLDALYADKWCLDRAIRLFGSGQQISLLYDATSANGEHKEEEEDAILSGLDVTLKRASLDLFTAYSMLMPAAERLRLPVCVTQEATRTLCRFAARRDGLSVRGISSAAYKNSQNSNEEAVAALQEYNRVKQRGALCAALLFYTARNLGSPRSLMEVCESIQPVNLSQDKHFEKLISGNKNRSFIQRKHCSRAMNEIKEVFPDFARSSGSADGVTSMTLSQSTNNDETAISNFIEHALRKLGLPPVAEASIRCLVMHRRHKEQGPAKLSTVCAALAYFVCMAGSTMQKLASQATAAQTNNSCSGKEIKRRKLLEAQESNPNEVKDETSFDVLNEKSAGQALKEQRAYEVRRMWAAWAEQRPWIRSLAEIEQSCGVSRNVVMELYKNDFFPNRNDLLGLLRDSVTAAEDATSTLPKEQTLLRETPMASALLPLVSSAAPLMKADVR